MEVLPDELLKLVGEYLWTGRCLRERLTRSTTTDYHHVRLTCRRWSSCVFDWGDVCRECGVWRWSAVPGGLQGLFRSAVRWGGMVTQTDALSCHVPRELILSLPLEKRRMGRRRVVRVYGIEGVVGMVGRVYPTLSSFETMMAMKEERKRKRQETAEARRVRKEWIQSELVEQGAEWYSDNLMLRYIQTGRGDVSVIRDRVRMAVERNKSNHLRHRVRSTICCVCRWWFH